VAPFTLGAVSLDDGLHHPRNGTQHGPMTTTHTTDTAAVKAGHDEFMFPCAPPYYQDPLVLVGAEGMHVVDSEGREYLDFFTGILTTGIGHCHPEVNAAVKRQVDIIGHTSSLYQTENQVEFARRLAAIAPGDLQKSFFTNSGTEAVETAVMLAQIYTGRSEIITLRHSYSGRGVLASNMTGVSSWRPLASNLPGIKHIRSPYPYRCPYKTPCDSTCVDKMGDDLEDAINTVTSGKPAAFFAETIQGVAGYVVPPPGYFQRMAEIIRSYGGLFIVDEVQAGFGRCGEHWFAIEHWDVVPDIMILAKAIASGFPVGATIAKAEIADAWTAKTISTYGGNPITMAAAIATNDVMVRENTPARSAERGGQLRAGLEALATQYHWMGEVRGLGLMQGIELVSDAAAKTPAPELGQALLEATREEGLLIGLGGSWGHVIRFGPSMLVSEAQVDVALEKLARACSTVEAKL
jgi:alanine-glyoxylate transaminase/(R)-3-amino-2-methylpropionate-pyruvate transaminase